MCRKLPPLTADACREETERDYSGKLSDERLEELKEYWKNFVRPGQELKSQAENKEVKLR